MPINLQKMPLKFVSPLPLLFSITLTAFLSSCTTASERQQPTPEPPYVGDQVGQPSAPPPRSTSALQTEMGKIEAAFAKGNCRAVLESTNRARQLGGETHNSTFFRMASTYCESEKEPGNIEKYRLALQELESAQRSLVPPFDVFYLEELKATLHLRNGNREFALNSKRWIRENIGKRSDQSVQRLDSEILQMTESFQRLPPAERERLQNISSLAQRDASLFAALQAADELLLGATEGDFRELVLNQRSQVVQRIEELFAIEAAQVEHKKASGREAEARAQAEEMRRRFPTAQYDQRIRILMQEGGSGPDAAPGQSGEIAEQYSGEGPLPPQLNVDKALADSRAALDSGNPELSVRILDAVPSHLQNERTRSLRRQARNVHVRQLRERVRELYMRASSQQDITAKQELLNQSKQLLELILTRYPDAEGRAGIERSLRSIERELTDLRRAG